MHVFAILTTYMETRLKIASLQTEGERTAFRLLINISMVFERQWPLRDPTYELDGFKLKLFLCTNIFNSLFTSSAEARQIFAESLLMHPHDFAFESQRA